MNRAINDINTSSLLSSLRKIDPEQSAQVKCIYSITKNPIEIFQADPQAFILMLQPFLPIAGGSIQNYEEANARYSEELLLIMIEYLNEKELANYTNKKYQDLFYAFLVNICYNEEQRHLQKNNKEDATRYHTKLSLYCTRIASPQNLPANYNYQIAMILIDSNQERNKLQAFRHLQQAAKQKNISAILFLKKMLYPISQPIPTLFPLSAVELAEKAPDEKRTSQIASLSADKGVTERIPVITEAYAETNDANNSDSKDEAKYQPATTAILPRRSITTTFTSWTEQNNCDLILFMNQLQLKHAKAVGLQVIQKTLDAIHKTVSEREKKSVAIVAEKSSEILTAATEIDGSKDKNNKVDILIEQLAAIVKLLSCGSQVNILRTAVVGLAQQATLSIDNDMISIRPTI